jgi:asparagine synthase (glutamine-hydrolysing)
MTDAVRHRGPDDAGQWIDAAAGVALGHRRLSVLDLSPAGSQPMKSSSGRFVVVFNGEIYNHLELRDKLPPIAWRGHSDTETLLAGIEQWGLEATLRMSVGMFALALWDASTRTLSLARDRMGEKPLYYGWQRRTFLFGSELKALRQHPDFETTVDRGALAGYVRSGYVAAPRSIYEGISKLAPGSLLHVRAGRGRSESEQISYWNLREVVSNAAERRFEGSVDAAVEELDRLLRTAIEGQRIADVPVGAFLSGGIDSSSVVAIMQAVSSKPAKTFSIGFDVPEYDEAKHAGAVAAHLGTEHTELYVSAQTAMAVVPDLPRIFDEPFADPSQIPTVLVARLAREQVTVSLSGDGGDELFCGYGRYAVTAQRWRQLARVPAAVRSIAGAVLPSGALSEAIGAESVDDLYRFTNKQWKEHPRLVRGWKDTPRSEWPPEALVDDRERMMYDDQSNYLPDDILVKVDRAAMAVSLETRVPLLDHRIVEFAWRLPIELKMKDGATKSPLRRLLDRYVPRAIVERPKMGFGVPIEHWLRGPLRDWAETLLSEQRLKVDGYFQPDAVRAEWERHLSQRKDRHYGLWTILMFQAWLDAQTVENAR